MDAIKNKKTLGIALLKKLYALNQEYLMYFSLFIELAGY